MKNWKLAGVVAGSLLGMSGVAVAGPDWIEQGDAGPIFASAQRILGVGQVSSISGTLSAGLLTPDLEDVYLLRISQPTMFSFDFSLAQFDCQAWLFNVTQANELFGLLANDNVNGNAAWSLIAGPSTDGSGAQVTQPGVYALAITGLGRVPVSRTGAIFNIASPTEVSGPDGQGGLNPLESWQGDGQTGEYTILTQGVEFFDVPSPGVAGVMLGGLVMASRRRRVG